MSFQRRRKGYYIDVCLRRAASFRGGRRVAEEGGASYGRVGRDIVKEIAEALAEATEAAAAEAEGGTTGAMLVDDNATASMAATPVFSPHQAHCDCLWVLLSVEGLRVSFSVECCGFGSFSTS